MATINTTTNTSNKNMNSVFESRITYRTDTDITVSVQSKSITLAIASVDLSSLTDNEIVTMEKVLFNKQGDIFTLTLGDLYCLVSIQNKWNDELAHRKEVEERMQKSRVMPITASRATAKVTEYATCATEDVRAECRRNLFTSDTMEYKIKRQMSVCRAMRNKTFSVVMYDITSDSDIANPCKLLWKYGAKLNLSCWLIADENLKEVKKELFELWDANKEMVRYHVIPQDPRANEALSKIIQEEVDYRLREVHTSLVKSMETISRSIEEMERKELTEREVGKQENIIAGRYRQVIRQAQEGLENLIKWAEKYDETGEYDDLFGGLRSAIQTERKIANGYLAAKNKKMV